MVIGLLFYSTLAALYTPYIIRQLQHGKYGNTNWELLVLGISGFVLTSTQIVSVSAEVIISLPGSACFSFALAGTRLGQRNFLLPCIVFLILTIVVDAIIIFAIFFLDWYLSDSTSLASCLFAKLVASLLVARALLKQYKMHPFLGAAASATK